LNRKPLWYFHGKAFKKIIKPEDLPVAVSFIHAFGGKAEKIKTRLSISILFSEAVTKKF
jgi:hypothetical protein